MKKVLVAVVLLVGLGVLAQRLGQKMSTVDWEERFDRMPDNAPPKWVFRNITTIRDNTDRILELLKLSVLARVTYLQTPRESRLDVYARTGWFAPTYRRTGTVRLHPRERLSNTRNYQLPDSQVQMTPGPFGCGTDPRIHPRQC